MQQKVIYPEIEITYRHNLKIIRRIINYESLLHDLEWICIRGGPK